MWRYARPPPSGCPARVGQMCSLLLFRTLHLVVACTLFASPPLDRLLCLRPSAAAVSQIRPSQPDPVPPSARARTAALQVLRFHGNQTCCKVQAASATNTVRAAQHCIPHPFRLITSGSSIPADPFWASLPTPPLNFPFCDPHIPILFSSCSSFSSSGSSHANPLLRGGPICS